jgi:hypothetical protein
MGRKYDKSIAYAGINSKPEGRRSRPVHPENCHDRVDARRQPDQFMDEEGCTIPMMNPAYSTSTIA